MATDQSSVDQYQRVQIQAVSSVDDATPLNVQQDPTTRRVLVDTTLSEVGFEIPAYDYIALTYVAAGNGAGEIETVTYKTGGAGGTTVATLTLTYNASDEIASVTKS